MERNGKEQGCLARVTKFMGELWPETWLLVIFCVNFWICLVVVFVLGVQVGRLVERRSPMATQPAQVETTHHSPGAPQASLGFGLSLGGG